MGDTESLAAPSIVTQAGVQALHGGEAMSRWLFGAFVAAVLLVAGCAPPPPTAPRAVEVHSEYGRACARLEDGTVRCWGGGYPGDGTTGPVTPLPVQVAGLDDVVDLGVGAGHTCAVRADGTLWCWGAGSSGQLGTPVDASTVPVQVPDIDDAVAVAPGYFHTCALDAEGEVSCWGDNRSGQLGMPGGGTRTEPAKVPGLPRVVELSAGYVHTCALDASGDAWCWGANERGALGNGQTDPASPTPTRVVGLSDLTAIDGGWLHTCAARADGTVWCWGGNNPYWGGRPTGQLGNGSTQDSAVPVQVVGLTDAVGVSAGYEHSCAVRANRSVACWGGDMDGELGAGEVIDHSSVPLPVVDLPDATQVSAAFHQSCALRSGGRVACWGSNWSGGLGHGGEEPQVPSPVRVWPPRA